MSIRTLFAVCLVLFLATSGCWALYANSYANVYSGGSLVSSDSDSDSGVDQAQCTSNASWTTGTSASGHGHIWRTTDGLQYHTPCNGNIAVVGDTYTCGAGVGWGAGWGYIEGPGSTVGAGLGLGPIELVVDDVLATSTIALNLKVDGSTLASGMASLQGDGTFTGSGCYSFFDVFFDISEDRWHANYNGPSTTTVTMPVGRWFEFVFDVTGATEVLEGPGDESFVVQNGKLVLPEGYQLIPEPATIMSLLIPTGLALLLRRRR